MGSGLPCNKAAITMTVALVLLFICMVTAPLMRQAMHQAQQVGPKKVGFVTNKAKETAR